MFQGAQGEGVSSFHVCPQKAKHHLNELQKWMQAVAISSDPRDGYETLMLLLQPPRILCASTGHYPHPFRNLCSTPLPGSRVTGTTSLGEHRVHLRLLLRHASLCHCRVAPKHITGCGSAHPNNKIQPYPPEHRHQFPPPGSLHKPQN